MANHPRYYPTGAPVNSELESAAINAIDIAVSKSPNGDEGSSHVGKVVLGGIKAQHMAGVQDTTTTAAAAGPLAVNFDFDVANIHVVDVTAFAGDQTVEITINNPEEGDQGIVYVKKRNGPTRDLTVNFLPGTGIGDLFGDEWAVDNEMAAGAIYEFSLETLTDPVSGLRVRVICAGSYPT